MQKRKTHSKNLSKQAIDLINYYNNLKTSITNEVAMTNLSKKKSLYIADQRNIQQYAAIVEEDNEESPLGLKRNCSRTEHVNINIYSQTFDLDEELQQDVKQLKFTLNQRITQLKSIINHSETLKYSNCSQNKENQHNNNISNKLIKKGL